MSGFENQTYKKHGDTLENREVKSHNGKMKSSKLQTNLIIYKHIMHKMLKLVYICNWNVVYIEEETDKDTARGK